MKPKHNRLARLVFPALIVVPALLQAAVINPDGTGNVTIANGYPGGAETILASGGSDDTYTVSVASGVTFTGDSVALDGIKITSNNYTVANRGNFNVQGFGIQSTNEATITNYAGALIQGQSGGIFFNNVGGTINNSGTIRGQGGSSDSSIAGVASINGVVGGNNMTVNNYDSDDSSGATIFGADAGVVAGNNLFLLNEQRSSITGGDGPGIDAGVQAGITNYGSISSNYDVAIESGDGLYLDNYSGATIAGGTQAGSSVTDLSGGYAGILTGNSATINNYGSITGTSDGILFELPMAGVASAPSVSTVLVDLSSEVNNYGLIAGGNGAAIVGNSEDQTITNYGGYISGSNSGPITLNGLPYSMRLGAGQDEVSLRNDSYVVGGIDLGDGVDSLDFHGGATSPYGDVNLLLGSVYGAENLNKYGSGLAKIGAYGDNFTVQSDAINVYGGSLYINGDVSASSNNVNSASIAVIESYLPTTITVGGGEIGGTGTWTADVNINSGGISAGSSPYNGIDFDDESAPAYMPPSLAQQAIGTLNITGSLNFNPETSMPVSASSPLIAALPSGAKYLRVDINPQSPISPGVNNDLITHTPGELVALPTVAETPITIGGQVNLTGATIVLAPTGINQTITNGSYTIIQSSVPIVGLDPEAPFGVTFESNVMDLGPSYTTSSGYNNQNTVLGQFFTSAEVVSSDVDSVGASIAAPSYSSSLLLTVNHDYEGLLGSLAGSNGAAFGAALDAATQLDPSAPANQTPENELVQDFIASMDYSNVETVLQSFQALDASASMAQVDALVSSNYHLHRLTQDHLAMTRSQGGVVQATPPTQDAKGAVVPGTTSTSSNRGNVWGDVSYDWKDNGTTGLEGDEFSFTAGVDYRVAPNLLLGIVFDGSTGDYDTASGSSETDSLRFAAYGTYGGATGFYADFLLGYGTHNLDSDSDGRGLLPSGTNSSTDADSLQGLITVGYAMERGTLKHGPFAGLEYQNIDVDGYTQDGLMPVDVSGYDVDSLRGLIGYRAECTYGRFAPYMSVAYAHEFEDGSYSTTATLPNNLSYGVSGGSLESAFLISIGSGMNLMPNLDMHMGYHGEISTSSDGTDSHGGTIGLNYAF